MRLPGTKWGIAAALVLVVLGVGIFFVFGGRHESPPLAPLPQAGLRTSGPKHTVIGTSIEGRVIDAYTYGNGETRLLFVGGMHGGYEWNSALLAYVFMDYLDLNPEIIPAALTVIVVPSVNPDGMYKVIGKVGRFTIADVPVNISLAPGRFNAHEVDLNRNFDCNWKPEGTWQRKTVSAGSKPFSEPEAAAIRDFVLQTRPTAAIFWHSQANAVYASQCKTDILSETLDIMNAYAHASKYPALKSFDSYPITGDAEGWLASIGIPAITVELQTHDTIEWERNLSGIKALFDYYSKKARSSP